MMKFRKNLSLLQKSSLIAAAFTVAFGLNGCSSSDDEAAAPTFTPFERIATLDVVLKTDGSGDIDYDTTYAKTKAVAAAIHTYIETVNDGPVTATDQRPAGNFPADWIVGGSENVDPAVVDAILHIPSPDKIDPTRTPTGDPAIDKLNTYKVQVMDICNSYYAKMALGVTPVVTGDNASKVANGFIHAPTLPCEVTVYNDADNIYVDMLNPEAIFSLFFSDVVYGSQMEDATFAEAMMQLPTDVKGELKTIVYAALDAAAMSMPAKELNITLQNVAAPYDYSYTKLSEKLGPAYTQNQIAQVVDDSPYGSPYLHFAYIKSAGGNFTDAEVKVVAQEIMNTMTLDGAVDVAVHAPALENILSDGSLWRSGRQVPLGLPGVAGKNYIIEACSPKYAKLALGTGRHHAPALPCEISVKAIESSVGGGYDTLLVSFLEPGFMFNVLFQDAFADMSPAELTTYEGLPVAVLDDLQKIVNYSVAVDLPLVVGGPGTLVSLGQFTYDMTPE